MFPGASAVGAVAAPIVSLAGPASAATAGTAGPASALPHRRPSAGVRALIREIDPNRIHVIVLRLTQFDTRHTASSQADPVRGIGAAA